MLLALAAVAVAAAQTEAFQPVDPQAPEWRQLAAKFAAIDAVRAGFEERRVFPFRREPVVLRGEVRIARSRGLSLRYTEPEERTVILDDAGMLVRDATGQPAAPLDPRAAAANEAFRHILRFDLAALARTHEVHGVAGPDEWRLRLVPRDPGTRRAMGDIFVDGAGAVVRRIELRRGERQQIVIVISDPRPVEFTAEEISRFFR